MALKDLLQEIVPIVNWSYMAKNYFHMSNSWMYHKLNGIDGNKKPIVISNEELMNTATYLKSIASKINEAADNLLKYVSNEQQRNRTL